MAEAVAAASGAAAPSAAAATPLEAPPGPPPELDGEAAELFRAATDAQKQVSS